MSGSVTSGMSGAQAGAIRSAILVLCIGSLALIFQPFSMTLFSIGAGLVVFAGLAFNLMPFAVAGRPLRGVVRTGVIVLVIFAVALVIAIVSTELYKLYLKSA